MPYVFLLACSNHSVVTLAGLQLDKEFEKISKEAMKALFHESANVFLFSQFSRDRAEMGLSAKDAVKCLAKKLNARVKNEDDIPEGRHEFGIDIAGIDSSSDGLGYPFFAFAQCTVATGLASQAKRS